MKQVKVRLLTIMPTFFLCVMVSLAFGENRDTLLADYEDCAKAGSWDCAFDNLAAVFENESSDYSESCQADERHGCSYLVFAAYEATIRASLTETSENQKQIMDRGMKILSDLTNGFEHTGGGELALSAIRFEACKKLSDTKCVLESAGMIRKYLDDDTNPELDSVSQDLQDFGFSYDLAMIAAELELEYLESAK